MNSLPAILNYINSNIYVPNQLTIGNAMEVPQNSEYTAITFKLTTELATKIVRFRVAKITPTKIS